MALKILYLSSEEDFKKWDDFVRQNPMGSIHQLSSWGIFQARSGSRDKFWILAVEDEGQIVGGSLVIRQKLPFKKSWLYLPRGPLFKLHDSAEIVLGAMIEELKDLAKRENSVWVRIDPNLLLMNGITSLPWADEIKINWRELGFKKAHAHYQPENTLMVDLTPTEKEILAQMKPKGRYNIKVAEKNGVVVRESRKKEDLGIFYDLLQETSSRDNFSGHGLKYYQEMLDTLGEKLVKLYLAEYQEKVIAGIIVTFFKDTAIYYFGASSNQFRNTMAPYLLQWRAMTDAKKAGMKLYDFLGVAPDGADRKHEWAGVTEFKMKFGGKRIDYLPAQEMVTQAGWFALIKTLKIIRGIV